MVDPNLLLRIGEKSLRSRCKNFSKFWVAPESLYTFHDITEENIVRDTIDYDLITLERRTAWNLSVDTLVQLLGGLV